MLTSSMVYREESPSCPAVDAVWTLAIRHDLLGTLPYPTLPDGCVDLIYRLRRDRAGKVDEATLLIAGPATGPDTFFPSAGEEFVGVRLAPGWGGLTLGVSPLELRGTFAAASPLSKRLKHLEQQLFTSSSQQQAALILRNTVEFWSSNTAYQSPVLESIRMLRLCGGQMRVEQMARHLGISTRSLHRQVKDRTGLSPKLLSRIFRFRQSLDRLNRSKDISLCEIASAAGYTDQAHMTREWRTLGGVTPRAAVGHNSILPKQETL